MTHTPETTSQRVTYYYYEVNIGILWINQKCTKPDYYELYDDELENENQYYQPNLNSEIHGEPSFWSNLTFYQLCTQCVVPAIWSTGNLLGTTLILCIFFRLFIVICKKKIC